MRFFKETYNLFDEVSLLEFLYSAKSLQQLDLNPKQFENEQLNEKLSYIIEKVEIAKLNNNAVILTKEDIEAIKKIEGSSKKAGLNYV